MSSINYPVTIHTKEDVLAMAYNIIRESFAGGEELTSPELTKKYLACQLGSYEREVFAAVFLDSQNRTIKLEELFHGTIDAANVYPREVVKAGLAANAAAVIFAHNHPSGFAEPSQADIRVTKQLVDAMQLVDIRVLDHIVVGNDCVSFAERGLL